MRERERKREKRRRHVFAGGEVCFRVIMNMNTGSTMQLSANHCLCPKGREDHTRPTSTAVLSLPLGSDPPHMRAVQPKDHLTITPVSMTQDQGGCGEKGQRGRGQVEVWSILPGK